MTIYSNAFIHDEGNDGISDKAQYYFLKLVFFTCFLYQNLRPLGS